MQHAKYIVFMRSGLEMAVVFSDIVNHSEMSLLAHSKEDIIGAGEVVIRSTRCDGGIWKIGISCFGLSTSLGVKSRGVCDEKVIAMTLYPDSYDRGDYVVAN
jgi:hypothetical protein